MSFLIRLTGVSLARMKSSTDVTELCEALRVERAFFQNDAELAQAQAAAARRLGGLKDPAAVDALIQALQEKQSPVPEAAAEALGKIGDRRAVDALIAHINDPSLRCAENSIKALGEIADPRAVPPLAGTLKKTVNRSQAAAALVKIGAPATEALVAGLKDRDAGVRKVCCEALAQIGDSGAASALSDLLLDRELTVRKSAAESLEHLGWQPGNDETGAAYWIAKEDWSRCAQIGSPAVKPLVASLHDPYGSAPVNAAKALVEIGAPAVEPLIASLQGRDDRVRTASVKALGEIGDHRAVQPLIAFTGDLGRSQFERITTAYALGKIGDPAAGPTLLKALQDRDERVREAAARNLGKLGDRQSVTALFDSLKDNDADVRAAAAEALGMLGDLLAVEPLLAAAGDPAGNVQRSAAEALGKFADPRAVEALIPLLSHERSSVRQAAARSLVQIYQSGALDEHLKKLVLEQRSTITHIHEDEHRSTGQSSDCTSYHVDSGIGVEFAEH